MIRIICVGKLKENYLKELVDDYLKRISKYHQIKLIELKDSNMLDESKEILKTIDNKDFVITLEIEGKQMSSIELASILDKQFIYNPVIDFVIGGSDGLDKSVKERSNLAISFSSFTFPHGLFRGILLEQIYRSMKINNNESYHK